MGTKTSAGIAGCHGKSTTSGMVAFILESAGRDPTYLIGAEVVGPRHERRARLRPSRRRRGGRVRPRLPQLHPDVAAVTNVEADHLDYYGTYEAVKEAFRGFAANVKPGGTLVLCADNDEALALRDHVQPGVNVVTYGFADDADWRATDVSTRGLGQSFMLYHHGEPVRRFAIALPVRHNVQNALGALVVCHALGLSWDEIATGLAGYRGVRRRFELVGEAAGILVYDDYAHHPTEIADTAVAAKDRFPGRRIVVLFQPHTYARTRYLLEEFKPCFEDFDRLFILETYAAREAIADGMTAKQLAEEITSPSPPTAKPSKAPPKPSPPTCARATSSSPSAPAMWTAWADGPAASSQQLPLPVDGEGAGRVGFDPRLRRSSSIAPTREGEALSRHTTIGIGGPADVYVMPETRRSSRQSLRVSHDEGAPVFMLGSGTNIVVGDRGMRGVTIENKAQALSEPKAFRSNEERFLFRADAGCSFAAVSRQLSFAGYTGLEWACGIPGTIGGAVVYNAGAYGGCLGDVLLRIGVWSARGGRARLRGGELGLVYRASDFTRGLMSGKAVLWAEFALWPGDATELRARIADYDGRRLKAQPRGRNAGLVLQESARAPGLEADRWRRHARLPDRRRAVLRQALQLPY